MSEDTGMPVSKAKIGGVIVALITWGICSVNYDDMDSPLIVIIISLPLCLAGGILGWKIAEAAKAHLQPDVLYYHKTSQLRCSAIRRDRKRHEDAKSDVLRGNKDGECNQ